VNVLTFLKIGKTALKGTDSDRADQRHGKMCEHHVLRHFPVTSHMVRGAGRSKEYGARRGKHFIDKYVNEP
jgi:hypothetical protein